MSCFGNTRVIAGQVQRFHSADMFEIMPAQAYPEDYQQTVNQAAAETRTGFEPPLKALVANIASYDVIYLGFPIWGMTAPPLIRSFLSNHDLSGKGLTPFITHGGYCVGQALQVIAEHGPGARIDEPFVIQRDQERDILEPVSRWLTR
jgi:flavodoxin